MRLTRRYRFAASHRLDAPSLSAEENREIYGKCNNPYGHGHNYTLEVSVRGPVEEESGLLTDRARLDRLVAERVLARFDHADLNEAMEAVPTTEHLAAEVRARLQAHWGDAFQGEWPKLDRIRIQETRRNIFEIHE